jgi:dTDP-glucose 4,6-dehydratase
MGAGHDLIEFIKDPRGNGHDFRYSVDASKLKAIGWQPQVKFKRDLAEKCVRWYQDNRWFLQL